MSQVFQPPPVNTSPSTDLVVPDEAAERGATDPQPPMSDMLIYVDGSGTTPREPVRRG